MFKKIFIFCSFLFLINCSAPGTALLGPALTGVTTKSAARAGVSYGSNHIMKKLENVYQTEQN
tara:strand:+ start:3148 stop:3336 length:189 start_codon:yes stop_codon:yes gene_type:complete